jgi:hypothetical protein
MRRNSSTEPISPELVLVDPALQISAREATEETPLATSPTLLPPGTVHPAAVKRASDNGATLSPTVETEPMEGMSQKRRRRVLLASAVTLAVVVAVVVVSINGGAHDKQSQPPSLTIAEGSSATGTPQGERRAASPQAPKVRSLRTMHWKAVPHASFYNVVLLRNGVRVLDVWPRRNHLSLTALTKRKGRVPAGRYQWFVYPGFGNRAARGHHSTFYGEVSARGTVVIRPRSTKSRR